MENYKEHLTNLLTELITKYVELEGTMEFVTGFINSKGQYVTLQERSDSTGLDYSIRSTMLDSGYGNENEIEGGEIIFQFNDDYYGIDIDEIKYYREDFNDYMDYKNSCESGEGYIKSKVDYILTLTYENNQGSCGYN